MDLTSAGYTKGLNREAPWDSFDSRAYHQHNYAFLRKEDQEIIEAVRDYFCEHFRKHPDRPDSGIDVGAGTNLYPALSLLPWCSNITLYEHSVENVLWLEREVAAFSANWGAFWEVFTERPEYRAVSDPRGAIASAAVVGKGDLFDLPRERWGIGTMFFVAESMSTAYREFEGAVAAFARALTPRAPFAAAFMENSQGYQVGDLLFPACGVDAEDVRGALAPFAEDLRISRVGLPEDPIRSGYTGMILACGRRG
ncbi:SCO2525 family SAM-dependent methyltransferase [Streptomyces syringium]|uniref:SCO2525 family SAM-dependent methyltransferase n=1 Tax=Streptomyces syringium TaxID=76729 RepID=UPI0033F6119E